MFVAQFIFDEPLGPSQPPSGGSVSRWEAWEVSSVGESSESFYANLAGRLVGRRRSGGRPRGRPATKVTSQTMAYYVVGSTGAAALCYITVRFCPDLFALDQLYDPRVVP